MMERTAFTEKYRPATLSQIVGQSFAVMQLNDFVDQPFPQAFLFSGSTGVGKSTAALALAFELGVDREWNLITINSGEMDADKVESALRMARAIGIRDGWKLVLCDEADMMSTKARSLWLSALEDVQRGVYGKTIIVFTTNNPEKFDSRFRDRCETLEFESDPKTLYLDAERLLSNIWRKEGLPGAPPRLDAIKGLVVNGEISFRRLVSFIGTESRRPRQAAPIVSKPVVVSRPASVVML